jgi:hypothetical protein
MSKEAMKLALEALEDMLSGDLTPYQAAKTITALQEALAEQPAQQEPVTWRNAAIRVGEDLCSVGPFGYYDMTAEQWLDWALSVVTVHAPPAQRTWVGLTNYEVNNLAAGCHLGNSVQDAIYKAAAKLKEKNNG